MDTTTTSTRMKPRHQPNGGGSEDIMAGIEQTRAHMDDTLDELSERLRPRHLRMTFLTTGTPGGSPPAAAAPASNE